MSTAKMQVDASQDGWMNWRNTLQQKVYPHKGLPKPLRAAGFSADRQYDTNSLPEAFEPFHPSGSDVLPDEIGQGSTTSGGVKAFTMWKFILNELSWGSGSGKTHNGPSSSENIIEFLRTPVRLEQFLWFGHALCVDVFLFHFTLLPLRGLKLAANALFSLRAWVIPASAWSGGHQIQWLNRSAIYDMLKIIIIVVSTLILGMVQVSRVYHYIRGEAIIKLYVIFNILEILDKLCASLGSDVIDSLHRAVRDGEDIGWLVSVLTGAHARLDTSRSTKHLSGLASVALRVCFTITYVTVHACVIFVQIVCLTVALNSKNNSLLTLLVSNNFVELKASVFKRFEPQHLFQVSCADAVERFQLMLYLLLIALQEGASEALVYSLVYMWVAELVVDWVKHSFVSKFNRLSSDLYPMFAAIIGHDAIVVRSRIENSLDPTHACVRRIGLSTMPLACVVLRMLLSRVHPSWFPRVDTGTGLISIALFVLALTCAKMLLSMLLLAQAAAFIKQQPSRQCEKRVLVSPAPPEASSRRSPTISILRHPSPFVAATPLLQAKHASLYGQA